jgi:TFIIH basal transcription factor complex TTD-A subunit
MPRATAGQFPTWHHAYKIKLNNYPKLTSIKGTLVQCDPSIKAIITKINDENNGQFISEDIDDETVLINSKKLDELKQRLKDVNPSPPNP